MTFDQVIATISGESEFRSSRWSRFEIVHAVTCDLMSDVLVNDHDGLLLITSLPSDQVARTADMVGACGIVLVNGKAPQTSLVDLCKELDLTLIRSPLTSFEASWRLGQVLLGSP